MSFLIVCKATLKRLATDGGIEIVLITLHYISIFFSPTGNNICMFLFLWPFIASRLYIVLVC